MKTKLSFLNTNNTNCFYTFIVLLLLSSSSPQTNEILQSLGHKKKT